MQFPVLTYGRRFKGNQSYCCSVQIQSSSKENIIFVAVFGTTRHVPGSEEVWLGSYFPYILLVFGQIRNFLFHHNLRQLRDFLFSLNIHFD